MIFEQKSVIFEILDVLYIDQKNIKLYNSNRNFDAISFRFEADTLIDSDNRKIELSDNAICYFPSAKNYTRISKKDRMIVINFNSFNYHAYEIEYFYPENPKKYAELFKKLFDCWNKKDTSYIHESASAFYTIFAEFYRDTKPEYEYNRKIAESVIYIKKNCLKKDFSLSDAVKKSFISEVYFRKLFKEEFGISPKKYIIDKRIKHAAALINTGHYPLYEISELCGYTDYKHFSTEFKKVTGISPSDYLHNG